MPELIDDADFTTKLNEMGRNRDHTARFLEKGVQTFTLAGFDVPFGYRLVKSKTEDQYRLITESDSPVTAYAVKLAFYDHIVPGSETCTQVMVWRSNRPEHQRAVSGLAALFFQYLVSHYSVVVSDSQQTHSGRRFWELRIMEALSREDMHVYVSDGTQGDRDGVIPLSEIHSDREFYEVWNEFSWGRERDIHSLRLLVISRHKLNECED